MRPIKEEVKRKFLQLLREGNSVIAASKACGFHFNTGYAIAKEARKVSPEAVTVKSSASGVVRLVNKSVIKPNAPRPTREPSPTHKDLNDLRHELNELRGDVAYVKQRAETIAKSNHSRLAVLESKKDRGDSICKSVDEAITSVNKVLTYHGFEVADLKRGNRWLWLALIASVLFNIFTFVAIMAR